MNRYTVGCGFDGIYAGIMNPTKDDGTKTWKVKSECTEEAIAAVAAWIAKNECETQVYIHEIGKYGTLKLMLSEKKEDDES